MAIKIGHASSDENKRASGGAAGDQTGGEVCIRTWYNGNWNVVLRPKSATLAEKSAKACEAACNNNKIGYDQGSRNTLYNYAKVKNFDIAAITDSCECDCSSLMHVCAIAGGANLKYGYNGLVTWNMADSFVNSGDYERLTAGKYLSSDGYLRRGDILVRESGHTAMVLENGAYSGTPATKAETQPKVDPAYKFDKAYAKTYKVIASSLNLRTGAGTHKAVVKVLKRDSKVTCYGYYNKHLTNIWLYVQTEDGTVGYCSKKYLQH